MIKKIDNIKYEFSGNDLQRIIRKYFTEKLSIGNGDIASVTPYLNEDSNLMVDVYLKPKTQKL